jgi:hypothetical protein
MNSSRISSPGSPELHPLVQQSSVVELAEQAGLGDGVRRITLHRKINKFNRLLLQ